MKYALLVYDVADGWENIGEDEMQKLYAEYGAVSQLPQTTSGAQLQPADKARSVRIENGDTLVTDGPFAETKEVFGGFYLVDVGSQKEAEEIAAKIPSARMGGVVEVRPLVEM